VDANDECAPAPCRNLLDHTIPAARDSVPSAWTRLVQVAHFKSRKELKALISRNHRSPRALLLPELLTFSRCPERQRLGSSDSALKRT